MSDRPNIFISTAPYYFALKFLAGVQEASRLWVNSQEIGRFTGIEQGLELRTFLHPHLFSFA
jgi:hypothetical protein